MATNMSSDADRDELVETAKVLMREARDKLAQMAAVLNEAVDHGWMRFELDEQGNLQAEATEEVEVILSHLLDPSDLNGLVEVETIKFDVDESGHLQVLGPSVES